MRYDIEHLACQISEAIKQKKDGFDARKFLQFRGKKTL